MISAVIIEDEKDAQKLLSNIIKDYCPGVELQGMAKSKDSAIKLLDDVKPDLVFMDIQIEGGNAFQVLDALEDCSFKVIFTTAYDNFAIRAFKYEAVDYLLKPYSPKEVIHAIHKYEKIPSFGDIYKQVLKLNNSNNGKVTIPTSKGLLVLKIEDIIRVEAGRSYCFIHLSSSEKITMSKPLKDIAELLPSDTFFRSHQSHLINVDCVMSLIKGDGGYIEMNDGTQVPISRKKKKEFEELLFRKH